MDGALLEALRDVGGSCRVIEKVVFDVVHEFFRQFMDFSKKKL